MRPIDRRAFLLGCGAVLLGACTRGPSGHARGLYHQVAPGETLSDISRRSGLSLREIITANRLRDTRVQPGQTLFLPGIHRLGPDPLAPPPIAAAPVALAAYQLVSRHNWGALPPKGNHDPMGAITRLTIHHTDEIAGIMQGSDTEVVRFIAHLHRDRAGWADIGYHFLIGRDGRVYEGRPMDIQGAHAGGDNNRNNIGIAVIGAFGNHLPNHRQMNTLTKLVPDLSKQHRLDAHQLFAHRDFTNTECPGDALYGWFRNHRHADLVARS